MTQSPGCLNTTQPTPETVTPLTSLVRNGEFKWIPSETAKIFVVASVNKFRPSSGKTVTFAAFGVKTKSQGDSSDVAET